MERARPEVAGWTAARLARWPRERSRTPVADACGRLEPATLRAGRAPVRIGSNRRLLSGEAIVMKPNPGRPRRAHGWTCWPWTAPMARPLSVVFSHAAHPVIIHGASRLTSAEFPGFAARRLEERLGASVVPLFGQAFAADINGDPLRGGIDGRTHAGDVLADAALAALAASDDRNPIQSARRLPPSATTFRFCACRPARRALEALNAAERRLAKSYGRTAVQRRRALGSAGHGRDARQHDGVLCGRRRAADGRQAVVDGRHHPVPARSRWRRSTRATSGRCASRRSACAIGDAWSLIAATHELFAEYQLRLDREAPTLHRMMLAYTNGCESYVPLDRDFALGGYEGGTFPDLGSASLRYRHRRALAPDAKHA